MLPRAILDTSALLCLYHLRLLHLLNLIFDEVRIPSEVQREFLEQHPDPDERTSRFRFLTQFFEAHDSWFLICNEYGSDLVTIYLAVPGMDRGEAEALAQNQYFDSLYQVILDERTARRVAESRGMARTGTLAILAYLDLALGACDYLACVHRLRSELNTRFSDQIIGAVYEQMRQHLGTAP
ncbi:MAG: hypothetical protein NW241_08765 [Bacteroidia bacterium]|nr:hypothetical protein [Bacteroidia bacterium]